VPRSHGAQTGANCLVGRYRDEQKTLETVINEIIEQRKSLEHEKQRQKRINMIR
jgi:hypothetical protein